MPLLDQPFGWTWLLLIGWTGYRLLSGLLLGVREAANLGRGEPAALFLFHLIGSAIVWAIFGAVGWRTFFDRAGPVTVICFGIMTGFLGLLVGIVVDFLLVARYQHRIAVSIVAGKATTYAEQLELGDSEQRVRAAKAMAFIGPKALFAVPQLLAVWKDRDAELRYTVAVALGCTDSDDPAVIAAMQSGLQDADARVRVAAAWALVKFKRADAEVVVPLLRAGLKMEKEVKEIASSALYELGPAAAPAVPDFIAMIGEDFNDNALARYVLAAIGSPATPALIPLLQADIRKVRELAIDILGEIGTPAREALPALQELLHDPDKRIREAATRAVAKVEGKE
jgi:HEAT repeats